MRFLWFHSVKYVSHTVVFVSHSVKQRICQEISSFIQGNLEKLILFGEGNYIQGEKQESD